MANLVIVFCVVASLYVCETSKILVIFPLPGRSHAILGDGYVRHLTNAGHEVTYITPFPKKDVPKNLHQIDVSDTLVYALDQQTHIGSVLNKDENLSDESVFFHVFMNISEIVVNNEHVKKMLNDPNQRFDVVIVEWMFNEIYAGFAAVYKAPLIWSSSLEPHAIILGMIGEDLNPAYNADLRYPVPAPFSFTQRVKELFGLCSFQLIRKYRYTEMEKLYYEKLFAPYASKKGVELPSFYDIRYNASMVLGNSHVSLGEAMSVPPSYVGVGGYHIDTDVKPLPQDLQKLMDEAKHGVIYFSMGTTLKSKQLPESLKKGFLKMFGGLKQTVIWKFEEVLHDVPKNVHVVQWAPQPSILCHPNLAIFITHGGLLSTTEAVHFSVPIIGIPVFADQFTNVARAVNKGFAKQVHLTYDAVDELKDAIEEVLTNPQYRTKAKELSYIYHHRPVPPGKELVHWVEHVIETRGALHLRTAGFMMPWYQKIYLDLVILLIVVLLTIKIIVKKLLRKKTNSEKKNN